MQRRSSSRKYHVGSLYPWKEWKIGTRFSCNFLKICEVWLSSTMIEIYENFSICSHHHFKSHKRTCKGMWSVFFFLKFIRRVNWSNTKETRTKPAPEEKSEAHLHVCVRICMENSSNLALFISIPVCFAWLVGERMLLTWRHHSPDLCLILKYKLC